MRRWTPALHRSRALLDETAALVAAAPGRRAGPWWRERERIRLVQEEAPPPPDGWPVAIGEVVQTPWGVLSVRAGGGEPDADPCCEVVDAAALAGRLRLRPWQSGDRMEPLGLGGRQLVSDLLNARKVPPSERARQLVLVAEREDGEAIVWAVGHRLDARARLTPGTARTATLRWEPA